VTVNCVTYFTQRDAGHQIMLTGRRDVVWIVCRCRRNRRADRDRFHSVEAVRRTRSAKSVLF